MEKKINPNLKKVTLQHCRSRAKKTHDAVRRACHESEMSGHKIWSELHAPKVILDIFEDMTEAEFQRWLHRLYGEKNIPA